MRHNSRQCRDGGTMLQLLLAQISGEAPVRKSRKRMHVILASSSPSVPSIYSESRMTNSITSSLWRGLFYYSGSLPHHARSSGGESSPAKTSTNATAHPLLLFSLVPLIHNSTLLINILNATEPEKKELRKLLYSGSTLALLQCEARFRVAPLSIKLILCSLHPSRSCHQIRTPHRSRAVHSNL